MVKNDLIGRRLNQVNLSEKSYINMYRRIGEQSYRFNCKIHLFKDTYV